MLAVAEFGTKRDSAGHKGAGTARDFLAARIEQHTISDVQALRAADHGAAREKLAVGNGPQEIKVEGRCEHEDIGDAGLHGEKGGVVESFEIHGAVNGARSVVEVFADQQINFGSAFGRNAEARLEPLVDGSGV